MVVCPHCRHESSGRFFCDRCHALLPMEDLSPLPAELPLADGGVLDCSGFGGTFPADCWRGVAATVGGRPARLYALNAGWWRDLGPAVRRREQLPLAVLAPLTVVPVEDAAVVVAQGLADAAHPLTISSTDPDPLVRLDDALACCRLLERALTPLHKAGLVWLNFDPAAVAVARELVQVENLDLVLYRAGASPDSLRLSPAYSPPEVCGFHGDAIGPPTDVYHVALHLWYRLAGLLPNGFPGLGLEAFNFEIPPLRVYNYLIPPGVIPVLERGLARDPADRFASVADLTAALAEAVERAHRRAAGGRAVRVDAGSATIIGRTHALQGLPNQDAHFLTQFRDDLWLAIVADGVTHARVGSGDKASRLAVDLLAERLTDKMPVITGPGELEEELCVLFLDVSQAILDAALTGWPAGQAVDPVDVMSTTAVVAVVRGAELTLAAAGDSRAYLLHEGMVEQLTVDGDVKCVHLAAGMPPEQLRELGAEASALYCCLGVGNPTADGRFTPCLTRTLPNLTRWQLVPGDVVVVCTDGLVEEGVFLEPAELAALLLGETDRPASELADRLVTAATLRHRDPSVWEPEGCGDDVTCVVLVVREAASAGAGQQ